MYIYVCIYTYINIYIYIYIYIMEYYSAIKKNEILPLEITHIDLEGIMLSKISQAERQILCDLSYM